MMYTLSLRLKGLQSMPRHGQKSVVKLKELDIEAIQQHYTVYEMMQNFLHVFYGEKGYSKIEKYYF